MKHETETGNSILRRLRNYFFAGLLVLVPIVATCWIILAVFNIVDAIGSAFFPRIVHGAFRLAAWILGLDEPTAPSRMTVKGVNALLTLLSILLVGLLARTWIVGRFLHLMERIVIAMPAVGNIYSTLRQVVQLVIGYGPRRAFRQPVLVEFPRSGCFSLAFVTNEDCPCRQLGLPEQFTQSVHQAVFVPTTPNPTSGFLIFLPQDQIRHINMTVEEAFKVILSGGMVIPEHALSGEFPEKTS